MLPTTHPLVKTATDLRRSINRLHIFREQNPSAFEVADGTIDLILSDLKEVRTHLPKEYVDADLKEDV